MSRAIPILILLAFATGVCAEDIDPEPPAGGPDLRKLRGTWKVTKLLFKGKDLTPPRAMTYTFDGDELTTDNGTQKRKMKVKVDPKKKPATIEMIPEGAKSGQVSIYQLEKEELRIALGTVKGGKVPTTLDGETGPVMVLTREKK